MREKERLEAEIPEFVNFQHLWSDASNDIEIATDPKAGIYLRNKTLQDRLMW